MTTKVNKNEMPSLHDEDKQLPLNIINYGRNENSMADQSYK